MNRVIVSWSAIVSGAITVFGQVAQTPVTQPAAPPAAVPGTVSPGTAAAPAGSGSWLNLGTGELTTGSPVASPSVPARVTRPPSLAGSSISPVQFQNINRIAVELNSLSTPVRDATTQQRALLETLQAAPVGTVKPSGDMINQLGQSLTEVLPTLDLTAAQRRQLAIDLNLALNSGSLTSAEADRVKADARALLAGSTVNNTNGVEQIMNHFTSIISDAQSKSGQQASATSTNAPSSSQTGQAGDSQTGQGSASAADKPASRSSR